MKGAGNNFFTKAMVVVMVLIAIVVLVAFVAVFTNSLGFLASS